MKKDRSEGFSNSFYIKRTDVDFFTSCEAWCIKNNLSLSNIIISALKAYFLESGELFMDFKEIFNDVVDEGLENTYIIHRNEKIKLKDLLEREFIVNDTINKI